MRLSVQALLERIQPGWQWLDQHSPFGQISDHRASLANLPPTEQRLMKFGYLTLLALVVVALSLAIGRPQLGSLSYRTDPRDNPYPQHIPWLALHIGVWSFVVGWALLLTAANNMSRRGFYLVLGPASGVIAAVAWLTGWPLLAVPIGAALLAALVLGLSERGRCILRDHQGVEFLVWSLALAVLVAGSLIQTETRPKLPGALEAGFTILVLLLVPALAALAIAAIWFVHDSSLALVQRVGAKIQSDRRRALLIGLLAVLASIGLSTVAIFIRRDLPTVLIVSGFGGLQGAIAFFAFLYLAGGHLSDKVGRFQRPIRLLGWISGAAFFMFLYKVPPGVSVLLLLLAAILLFLPEAASLKDMFPVLGVGCVVLLWLQLLALAAQASLEEAVFLALRVPAVIVLVLFLLAGLLQLGSWLAQLHIQAPPRWRHRMLVALFLVPILGMIVLIMIGDEGIFGRSIIVLLALVGSGGFVACYFFVPPEDWKTSQSSGPNGALSTRILFWQGLIVLAVASAVFSSSVYGDSPIGELQSFLFSEMGLWLWFFISCAWVFWHFRVEAKARFFKRLEEERTKT